MDRDQIEERLADADAYLADGYEEAFIGIVNMFDRGPVALYDREKCIDILMERDGMTWNEAEDFFQYNTLGAWMGEGTPAFATLTEEARG